MMHASLKRLGIGHHESPIRDHLLARQFLNGASA